MPIRFKSMAEAEATLKQAAVIAVARKKAGPILKKYRNDPVLFAEEMFEWGEGEGLTDYQKRILAALPGGRVAVYGPHGLGKTMVESIALIWFALTRENLGEDWKNPTTASAWRQLTHYLWPEVHKWMKRVRWDKMQRPPLREDVELLDLRIKLRSGESFALASDNAASIEGAHADSIFFQFDEAKTIPVETWDATEGALAGTGEALALAASTPGEESGRFYDICSRRFGYEDWNVIHVTVEEAVLAGRISESWVEQRRAQWGESSAVFKNRVLGEFASSASDGVIPLAWVEAAVARWEAIHESNPQMGALTSIGADIGGGGDGGDLTTLALRDHRHIWEVRRHGRGDTMETVGRIQQILSAYSGRPVVDADGIGAGVASRLRELDVQVTAFHAGAAVPANYRDASGELSFANRRAWAWWNLREMLDPANGMDVALPPDDLLVGDLTAPKWRVQSGGRILIESKDEIRKRLGRSTDSGDAVVMAFTATEGEVDEITTNGPEDLLRESAEDAGLESWETLWTKEF